MDPNANLREQLELVREIQGAIDGGVTPNEESVSRLTDLVTELDGWIKKGGFLPAAWIKPESLKCDYCQNVYWSEPGCTGIRRCPACDRPVDANPNRQGLAPKETKQ